MHLQYKDGADGAVPESCEDATQGDVPQDAFTPTKLQTSVLFTCKCLASTLDKLI